MGLQEWLVQVAIKKAVQKGAMAVVAYLITLPLAKWGVSIDQDALSLALTGGVMAGLEFLRSYLKNRFNLKFL